MKTITSLAFASVIGLSALHAGKGSDYRPEMTTSSEVFTSKVLKVYAAHDGDFDYVAYVVNWKDSEVVVSPMLSTPDAKRYSVGDVVRCQMMEMRYGAGRTRISFTLMNRDAGDAAMDTPEELRRARAVADEVARRRELREAAKARVPAPAASPAAPEPRRP